MECQMSYSACALQVVASDAVPEVIQQLLKACHHLFATPG
jgi:hypothetical protein